MSASPAILITMIKLSEKLLDNNVIDDDVVLQNLAQADVRDGYDPRRMSFGPLMVDTSDMFSAVPNAIRELSDRTRAYTTFYRNPTKDPSRVGAPFNFSSIVRNPEIFTPDIASHKGLDPGPLDTARPVSSPNIGFWDSVRTLNVPKPKQ